MADEKEPIGPGPEPRPEPKLEVQLTSGTKLALHENSIKLEGVERELKFAGSTDDLDPEFVEVLSDFLDTSYAKGGADTKAEIQTLNIRLKLKAFIKGVGK